LTPCKNNGQCVGVRQGGYTCICERGYTGTNYNLISKNLTTSFAYAPNWSYSPGGEYYAFFDSVALYKNYSYRIRFLKYVSGSNTPYETKVGGDYSWASWPGSHTYRINDQTITGTDFEAYWNYLASRYGATTGGAANLGA
jgi:hypothetical protein